MAIIIAIITVRVARRRRRRKKRHRRINERNLLAKWMKSKCKWQNIHFTLNVDVMNAGKGGVSNETFWTIWIEKHNEKKETAGHSHHQFKLPSTLRARTHSSNTVNMLFALVVFFLLFMCSLQSTTLSSLWVDVHCTTRLGYSSRHLSLLFYHW